ncbi:glycosyl transferase family 2 [Sphingobium sp. TomMM35A]
MHNGQYESVILSNSTGNIFGGIKIVADGTADNTKDQSDASTGPVSERLPHVVVLLSTYNGAAYLQEQLESLRAQEGVLVHLHARDDGSTDDTCAILQRFPEVLGEPAEFSSGPNLGVSASFLQLLRTAPDADYYAFCDQDDVWLPDKLARAVTALAHEEGPALYCSNMTLVDADLGIIGVPSPHRDLRFEHLLFENFATGCTILLNPAARALINNCPPANGAIMMHDWWCALIVSALGRVHYDPQPRILYRQHGGNVVGLDASWAAQKMKQISRLLRQRRAFYSIHAQATECLRLFGARLSPRQRAWLDRLVNSKRSFPARLAYALSGPVIHRDLLGSVVVRCLILAGWY